MVSPLFNREGKNKAAGTPRKVLRKGVVVPATSEEGFLWGKEKLTTQWRNEKKKKLQPWMDSELCHNDDKATFFSHQKPKCAEKEPQWINVWKKSEREWAHIYIFSAAAAEREGKEKALTTKEWWRWWWVWCETMRFPPHRVFSFAYIRNL